LLILAFFVTLWPSYEITFEFDLESGLRFGSFSFLCGLCGFARDRTCFFILVFSFVSFVCFVVQLLLFGFVSGKAMSHNLYNTLREFDPGTGGKGRFYSLPALEQAGIGGISRLPVSLRIVLESVLRNCDNGKITEDHIRQLANWEPKAHRTTEIPFVVSRILLQDFTGVPLLCDLAAMRGVAVRMGGTPAG
jgi:hypothetical protein